MIATGCMMSFTPLGSTFAKARRMQLDEVLTKDLYTSKGFLSDGDCGYFNDDVERSLHKSGMLKSLML